MTLRSACLTTMLGLFFGLANVATASAYCGTIQYSATGPSQEEALTKANNRGLADVRKLNQEHGNRIAYQPAKHNCSGTRSVRCTITQTYCVTISKTGRDDCPGDSYRNKQGKCVKDSDPVTSNPCSGGRLFSLSAQICHCPDNRPVWTGQTCITSQPVSGPSNNQIIQRCNLLDQECKKGITGSCRALKVYCDRG